MKQLLLLLLLLATAFAADPFPRKGKTIDDFAIDGWKITAKASGDLNKDGLADYALEMTAKDTIQFISKEEHISAEDSVYYHPTNLLILFNNGNGYIKKRVAPNAVPDDHDKYRCITLEAMDITRGVLNISTYSFMSMGGWTATSTTKRYRFQNGDFYKIGQDETSFHRAHGDAEAYSTNYLTGKRSIKTFNMFNDSIPEKTRWEKLKKKPLTDINTNEF